MGRGRGRDDGEPSVGRGRGRGRSSRGRGRSSSGGDTAYRIFQDPLLSDKSPASSVSDISSADPGRMRALEPGEATVEGSVPQYVNLQRQGDASSSGYRGGTSGQAHG
eukprot:9482608-Pyramimonas_sp.AAC.2